MSISFGEWDITKVSEGSGGGSFSTAKLSYPTGGEAFTDVTLYNYIKDLYDVGYSKISTNYTLVGLPIVSDFGLASGFGDNNYLSTGIPFKPTEAWSIEGSFKITSNSSTPGLIVGYAGNGVTQVRIYENKLEFNLGSNTTDFNIGSLKSDTLNLDQVYHFKAEFTGSEYTLYIDNEIVGTVQSSTQIASAITELLIGNGQANLNRPFSFGEINLNTIVIKIGGVVVFGGEYVPCRYISTGSRVVDVAYLDVVQLIANSKGSALYYVIDTTNQTVRLPIGDIFGFISQALR